MDFWERENNTRKWFEIIPREAGIRVSCCVPHGEDAASSGVRIRRFLWGVYVSQRTSFKVMDLSRNEFLPEKQEHIILRLLIYFILCFFFFVLFICFLSRFFFFFV